MTVSGNRSGGKAGIKMYGLSVVGAKSPTHGYRHSALRRSKPPDVVSPPPVVDDAVVLLQIRGLLRRCSTRQVPWSSDEKCSRRADSAGNERGIADLADTDLKVDPLFNHIEEVVVQDEINRQLFVLLQQRSELAAEI